MTLRPRLVLPVLLLVLAACSASVSFGGADAQDAAVVLIEGELADQAGLGSLDVECDEVDDPAVGDSFACTGTTGTGEVIRFAAEVTSEDGTEADGVDVNSVNLLAPSNVPGLVDQAAQVLGEDVGIALTADDLVCPADAIVVQVDSTVACELTDPTNGDVFVATITFTDPETAGFVIEVGEQIG
jgi:hypothetical protein